MSRRTVVYTAVYAVVCAGVCLGCNRSADGKLALGGDTRPDVPPVILNKGLPFRYPPALYAEKTQGNVTLRLFVDKDGGVVDDSTRIVESSTVPALDSAALKGAHDLRFVPAKLHGTPMPVSILFPVYFRHPEAPPPVGDSVLKSVSSVPSAPTASKP